MLDFARQEFDLRRAAPMEQTHWVAGKGQGDAKLERYESQQVVSNPVILQFGLRKRAFWAVGIELLHTPLFATHTATALPGLDLGRAL